MMSINELIHMSKSELIKYILNSMSDGEFVLQLLDKITYAGARDIIPLSHYAYENDNVRKMEIVDWLKYNWLLKEVEE